MQVYNFMRPDLIDEATRYSLQKLLCFLPLYYQGLIKMPRRGSQPNMESRVNSGGGNSNASKS